MGPAIAKATAWSKYTGTYTWKHVDAEVLVVNGELTMINADAPNPWDSRVRLTPVGPHTFKMSGGPNDGELLKFDVDQTGAAMKFTASSYYRIRKR